MSDPVTVGQVAQNISSQMSAVSSLLSSGAYVAGTMMMVRGALAFKAHSENPEQVRLSVPVTYMLVTGALLSLPTFIDISNQAMGLDPAPAVAVAKAGAAPAASPVPAPGAAPAIDASQSQPAARAAKASPAIDAVQPKLSSDQAAVKPSEQKPAAGVAASVSLADSTPAVGSPRPLKEPAHGGSGDLQALLEILSLAAALGLGGFYWIAKALRRGEDRRLQVQAAMADLQALSAPSDQQGPAA